MNHAGLPHSHSNPLIVWAEMPLDAGSAAIRARAAAPDALLVRRFVTQLGH